MPPVVAKQNYPCVFAVRCRVKRIEDATDLCVNEGDAGKVGPDRRLPLSMFDRCGVSASSNGFKGPLARDRAEVLKVILAD